MQNMHTPIRLSLVAGLSLAGVGAATAGSDISVWRWHVTKALLEQQNRDYRPPSLHEVRASAIDPNGGFIRKNELYSADGSLAPASDSTPR
jgi:hypothetical protein